jgi:hypothetical protein
MIELLVVLAIVVLVTIGIAIGVRNIRTADLEAAGGYLAGSMRYLHNLAVVNNHPYRLVIDLNGERCTATTAEAGLPGGGRGQCYWAEELKSSDPCSQYLPTSEEGDEEADEGTEEEKREARKQAAAEVGERGVGHVRPAGADLPPYLKPRDNLLKERGLPRGVFLTGILTTHHEERRNEGLVSIYFFPGGYADDAYVWLGEADEDAAGGLTDEMTVELRGIMGRARVHGEPLDAKDFLRETKR